MKRVIITILIFLFGIGCGFGAFFMLKTGGNMKKEELKSVQRLEVPKTEWFKVFPFAIVAINILIAVVSDFE